MDNLDGTNPRTRARTLSCVRSFYRWALRNDLLSSDPTRRLDAPAVPKGAPRYINRQQLDTLLRELPADLRRAVVLGAWAGLRVSEAAALKWSDIDRDRMCINVRAGKGNKSRAVPMHTVLLDSLLPDTGGNVITGTRRAYDGGSLQRRVNRAMRRVGIDATFHQLRHRYGTMTYGITGDPLAVAAAMGHQSLNSTKIYAAISDDAMTRIAAAAIQ